MENDYPCELESVISFRLNFENLQKFLEFLDQKNRKNQNQINDIFTKLNELEAIKEELKEVNIKMETMNKRQEEMSETLVFHSNKLIEFEKNYVNLDERIIYLEKDAVSNKQKFFQIDESINNLNKVTENNCSRIEKLEFNLTSLKSTVDTNCEKLEHHEKTINLIQDKLNQIESLQKEINEFRVKVKSKIKKLKIQNVEQRNFNINFQNKLSELDEKVDNMLQLINELSINFKMKTLAPQLTSSEDGNGIIKEDLNLGRINVELTELKLRFENLNKEYDMFKKSYKSQTQQQQQQSLIPEKKDKSKVEITGKFKSGDFEAINEKVNELIQENTILKEKQVVVLFELEQKIGKEDFERNQKSQSIEIEKIYQKLVETVNRFDNKMKAFRNGDGSQSDQGFDLVELVLNSLKKEKSDESSRKGYSS